MEATTEVIATLTSMKMARRVLDELAGQGGLRVSGYGEWSPIYRDGDNELTISKKSEHQWLVVKKEVVSSTKK